MLFGIFLSSLHCQKSTVSHDLSAFLPEIHVKSRTNCGLRRSSVSWYNKVYYFESDRRMFMKKSARIALHCLLAMVLTVPLAACGSDTKDTTPKKDMSANTTPENSWQNWQSQTSV